jgi:hypothetical protein
MERDRRSIMAVSSANSLVSSVGKAAYIYDGTDDTWYPVAGSTNPGAHFTCTGNHSFGQPTTFDKNILAKNGINNFANIAARDAAITAPVAGIVCFIQDINQLQYYSNGWKVYGDNALLSSKTSSFTLALTDAGRTIEFDSATNVTVTIPKNVTVAFPIGTQISVIQTGAGAVSFAAADGTVTTILSKNSNKKIAARYSAATLIKKSTDSWYLIGDLTA